MIAACHTDLLSTELSGMGTHICIAASSKVNVTVGYPSTVDMCHWGVVGLNVGGVDIGYGPAVPTEVGHRGHSGVTVRVGMASVGVCFQRMRLVVILHDALLM